MVALEVLHILDLESFKEQIVKSQQSNSIIQVESEHECFKEIISSLDGRSVNGLLAFSDIDSFLFGIHTNLQFHVLDNGLADFLPVVFEWSHSVGWNDD